MQALVSATIHVQVAESQFLVSAINEPYLAVGPTANGLVRSVGGAAMVATGIYSGEVTVECEAYEADPGPVTTDGGRRWTEIAEVPLQVPSDDVRVLPLFGTVHWQRGVNLAASGPGLYQLRVCAYGRDSHPDAIGLHNEDERYLVQLWPTTDARSQLVAAADSVGENLRRSHQDSDEHPISGFRVESPPQKLPATVWTSE